MNIEDINKKALYKVSEVLKWLGISRAKLYQLINDGTLVRHYRGTKPVFKGIDIYNYYYNII